MNENDRVAIASTSGDIGFLQQFTDNKSVLRAAAGRLIQHPYNVRDMTDVTTPMTEYMALTIELAARTARTNQLSKAEIGNPDVVCVFPYAGRKTCKWSRCPLKNLVRPSAMKSSSLFRILTPGCLALISSTNSLVLAWS